MTNKRSGLGALAIAALVTLISYGAAADPVISPGTPITNYSDVPPYLTDGSYLFGITVPSFGPDDFLLPVQISGAANLESWQFTLTFDNKVVGEVDPGDGSAGIYGAEFTSGNSNTLTFILGGFPVNAFGEVDSVAGSYPSLLTGPSGDGVLAFILFEFVPGQEQGNPNFSITDTTVVQGAPEPATLLLVASSLVLLCCRRFVRGELHN